MTSKRPSELLYDSEATLRLVDSAILEIGELGETAPASPAPSLRAPAVADDAHALLSGLTGIVAHGYTEILGVLDALRESRQLLRHAEGDRGHRTHDTLRGVSDVTETAAVQIMNGLDRATSLVDDLDALAVAGGGDDPRGPGVRAALRDEIFALMGFMQFQDITSQQLQDASARFVDMETRLDALARVFGSEGVQGPHLTTAPVSVRAPFDPDATADHSADGQAIADEIVAARRVRA